MEMFTHHTHLLEGKEVTQGLGEAGFEFLFPETKSSPSPAPCPSPSIPLPLVLEAEERVPQLISLQALDHIPAGICPGPGLVSGGKGSEGQLSVVVTSSSEYIIIASDICASGPGMLAYPGWWEIL